MAQTQRSITDVFTLLADNTSGAVSPQDHRDSVETMRTGLAEMYISTAAAVTPDDTATYKNIAGTWTLSATAYNWDMNTNGQLRYTGAADRYASVVVAFSMTAGTNNQVLHFRIALNGTSIAASEIHRKVGTGADVGAAALTTVATVSTGDYLTVQVRNETSTGTVTATTCNIVVHDGPA